MSHRVFVVDDHPLLLDAVKEVLSSTPHLHVCGGAGNAMDALEGISQTDPDAAIIDIELPGMSGIELTSRLAGCSPHCKTVMYSAHTNEQYVVRSLQAGARGYVQKNQDIAHLVEAITQVLTDDIYVPDSVRGQMLKEMFGSGAKPNDPVRCLSERQFEVFRLLGKNMAAAEIADALCVSVETISAHLQTIKQKLSSGNINRLRATSIRWHLQHEN